MNLGLGRFNSYLLEWAQLGAVEFCLAYPLIVEFVLVENRISLIRRIRLANPSSG